MKNLIPIALAAALAAAPVMAGDWGMGHGHRMGRDGGVPHMGGHGRGMAARMDLNGDGKVSPAEAEAIRTVMFLQWDKDGDGVVTEEELMAPMIERIRAQIAKRFEMHDANGDGRIDRAEFDATSAVRFVEMDADGDGVLSGDELNRPHHRERGPGR